jgi:hypothetical protein
VLITLGIIGLYIALKKKSKTIEKSVKIRTENEMQRLHINGLRRICEQL